MSILHTINKSPFEKNSLTSCLGHLQEGASVLLYEDGVYAGLKGTSVSDAMAAAKGVKLYALGPDLMTRGISEDKLMEGVEVVDYAGFVDLAESHDKVLAWV